MSTMKTSLILGLLLGVLSSCGPLAVDGHRVHSAPALPSQLETYPHVAFDDREAYLIGDEWFYRDSTYGWVVFEEEPAALHAFRVRAHATDARPPR
jgi:hypothetical protein